MQIYAPVTSYPEDDINSFYSDSDGRPQCSNKDKNKFYGNGNGKVWARIENRNLARISNIKYKIMNTMFQKKARRRWA